MRSVLSMLALRSCKLLGIRTQQLPQRFHPSFLNPARQFRLRRRDPRDHRQQNLTHTT
jgi:hypothetical protein